MQRKTQHQDPHRPDYLHIYVVFFTFMIIADNTSTFTFGESGFVRASDGHTDIFLLQPFAPIVLQTILIETSSFGYLSGLVISLYRTFRKEHELPANSNTDIFIIGVVSILSSILGGWLDSLLMFGNFLIFETIDPLDATFEQTRIDNFYTFFFLSIFVDVLWIIYTIHKTLQEYRKLR